MRKTQLRTLPRTLCAGLLCLALSAGCTRTRQYDLLLHSTNRITPAPQETATDEYHAPSFSDDSLSIRWEVGRDRVSFMLMNLTAEPMSVLWDSMSFIDTEGRTHRVVRSDLPLDARSAPPTVVAPYASLSHALISARSIVRHSGKYFESWMTADLFSEADEGKQFQIFFPLVVGRARHDYLFTFSVSGKKAAKVELRG